MKYILSGETWGLMSALENACMSLLRVCLDMCILMVSAKKNCQHVRELGGYCSRLL